MNVYSTWNSDHDICVLRLQTPGATFKQFPTDAFNNVLYAARTGDLEPYIYNIWSSPTTLWGWMVTESMELADDQAYAMAQSIASASDLNPQLDPFNPQTFEF